MNPTKTTELKFHDKSDKSEPKNWNKMKKKLREN